MRIPSGESDATTWLQRGSLAYVVEVGHKSFNLGDRLSGVDSGIPNGIYFVLF